MAAVTESAAAAAVMGAAAVTKPPVGPASVVDGLAASLLQSGQGGIWQPIVPTAQTPVH